ncbi:hypothetical protein [Klebsiella sp. BIGb0407]|uniref:hypothetical protein n=1 Tax=Klebsiella sp. BIGb0407 TaxID=2940603 RepID=UPI0021681A8F|nr:hypothetical protein [Klebsiella sp. BIGb0407]MCS3431332.1 hypothetical protein [Klebsiella sp. BIGb0407]
MLPDSFISKDFAPAALNDAEKSISLNAVNDKLSALEKKILSGSHYAGQSRNRLLEETDRHIKARLLCAIRIEVLHNLINELVNEEVINQLQLQELLNDKTDFITAKQQAIWLNQLTQEINGPLYYSFEG